MKYLEIQIDTKNLEKGNSYNLNQDFAAILFQLGAKYNPSRMIWQVPFPQRFGTQFYEFLAKAGKAIEKIKGLDGCYAKESKTSYNINTKVGNDGKYLYIYNSNDMTFEEFISLKGTLISNKNNNLSKLENYIITENNG